MPKKQFTYSNVQASVCFTTNKQRKLNSNVLYQLKLAESHPPIKSIQWHQATKSFSYIYNLFHRPLHSVLQLKHTRNTKVTILIGRPKLLIYLLCKCILSICLSSITFLHITEFQEMRWSVILIVVLTRCT